MTGHTKEPWSVFAMGNTTQIDVGSKPTGKRPCVVEWGGFDGADLPLRKNRANARRIVDCVNALAGIENPAAFVQAARVLHRALEGVIDATASYLPPDGISKDDCINRVLAASDNPEVFHALEAFRAATGEA